MFQMNPRESGRDELSSLNQLFVYANSTNLWVDIVNTIKNKTKYLTGQ